jgi:hypothetical protein
MVRPQESYPVWMVIAQERSAMLLLVLGMPHLVVT